MQQINTVVKNTPGYSAPVAARTYAYLGLGMTESLNIEKIHSSIGSRLIIPLPTEPLSNHLIDNINTEIVLNTCMKNLADSFFMACSKDDRYELDRLYIDMNNRFKHNVAEVTIKNSEEVGQILADIIFTYSKNDGGYRGFNRNFPESFEYKYCDSCWTRTPISFLPALLPYWGENKTLVISKNSFLDQCHPPNYSTDTHSVFFKEVNKVYKEMLIGDSLHELIAEYWNDDPGYSGTPSGHIMSIALQLAKANNLSSDESAELFALIGLALNDANIITWKLKYKFYLIRPITYIHRYIDKKVSTLIPTPPFPEFPSGHSTQSGAGFEVLKAFFGDSSTFVDSTHMYRTDIIGNPREFSSFSEAAAELSISRFYGGIHYEYTLDESLHLGQLIGKSLTSKLKVDEN